MDMSPVNYFGHLVQTNPGEALLAGIEAGQQQRAAQAQAQAQAEREARQQALADQALEAVIANPTPQNYNAYFLRNPKAYEATKAAQAGMDEAARKSELTFATSVAGYLDAERPADAVSLLDQRIAADEKAGKDAAAVRQFRELVQSNPKAARAVAGMTIAAATGPEKFADTFKAMGSERRADELQPLAIEQASAGVNLTREQANKTNVEASLLPDQAAADIELKAAQTDNYLSAVEDRAAQREILAANGPPLPPAALTAINDRVAKATTARGLAERATTLADEFVNSNIRGGGVFAMMRRGWNSASGTIDPVVALRQQYDALMVSQAIANLPPGPASDKDIKLAMKGFPSGNADGTQMASFLRGMAKLQNIVAEREDAQADWMTANGGTLGRAKRGFFVGNDFIEPGTTFGDYQRQMIEGRERARAQEAAR